MAIFAFPLPNASSFFTRFITRPPPRSVCGGTHCFFWQMGTPGTILPRFCIAVPPPSRDGSSVTKSKVGTASLRCPPSPSVSFALSTHPCHCDNARFHTSRAVQDYLKKHPRVTLHYLPKYAPENQPRRTSLVTSTR